MSSEPKRNFVLIQMDNTIYKYDLITKELLFRWKTTMNNEIILFDKDDKLCTVADNELKLWDFEDGIEQPPSIYAIENFGHDDKILRVFINEGSNTDDTDKTSLCDNWFYVVTFKDRFRIYRDRLEFTYCEWPLDEDTGIITSAAFHEDNTLLFLGTSNGMIRYVNLLASVAITSPEMFGDSEIAQHDESQCFCVEEGGSPYENKPITNI